MADIELGSFTALDPPDSLDSSDPNPRPGPSTLRHRRRKSNPEHATPPISATPAVATGLGLLTTFTLPRKYDHMTLLMRLWLQSRVLSPPPDGPEGSGEVELLPEMHARSISWRNFKTGIDILRLVGPRCAAILFEYRKALALPSLMYFVSVIADGVLPAASVWASGQMLDLVEKSFAGSPSTWETASRVAAMAIGIEVFNYMSRDVFKGCSEFLTSFSTYHLERLYMSAKLTLMMSNQEDDTFDAVVEEAAVFAGFKAMDGIDCPPYGPWSMISSAGDLVSASIELGLQSALIFRTLQTALRGSTFSAGNTMLIGLSLAPLCVDVLSDQLAEWLPNRSNSITKADAFREQAEQYALRQFAEGSYRSELTLFNLKSYILRRLDEIARKRYPQRLTLGYGPEFYIDILRLAATEFISNAIFLLLAVRAIPSTLTLGDLHLYRSSAERMHSTIRQIKWKLEATWQIPYFLAAMFASQEGPPKTGPQLNYEKHRRAGGMRLEARSLGLSYDGTNPILQDINITVEAGESLAVVGFNGSGKTTLVRALLGLHSHSGTLLINGIPFEDFDPVTLHSRMSCLFQDYNRYHGMSVRQNVGFGDTDKMDDDKALNAALERGGAFTFVQEIGGLDRILGAQHPTRTGDKNKSGRDTPAIISAVSSGSSTPADGGTTVSIESTEGDLNGDPNGEPAAASGDGTGPVTAAKGDDKTSEKMGDSELTTCISSINKPRAELSGGQWQRIALSRAFMRHGEADLIILDEPSAALDARTEKELFDTVHSLSERGKDGRTTCIFISHRFATVKKASHIAFVEAGRIVEYGTHAQLMALNGRYAEMYNIQKSAFDD